MVPSFSEFLCLGKQGCFQEKTQWDAYHFCSRIYGNNIIFMNSYMSIHVSTEQKNVVFVNDSNKYRSIENK